MKANLPFHLFDYLGGFNMHKKFIFLKNSENWNNTKKKAYQNYKFRKLMEHVYVNVPYYSKLMKNLSLTPKDFRSVDDITKLPLLTKKIIRDNFKSFFSVKHSKNNMLYRTTGGSTGEPLEYYITKDSWAWYKAAMFRIFEWGGHNLGENMAVIGGSSLLNSDKTNFKKKAYDLFVERTDKFSAFDLNSSNMKLYAEDIFRIKPKTIRGYANALYIFSNYMIENNIVFDTIETVLSTAEKLESSKRKIIESAFKCKVFDQYGAYDGGLCASECSEHNGLHIITEICLVEILKLNQNNPKESSGEVILTNLVEYGFPLIRYEVGDIAEISTELCSCSNHSVKFKNILGRNHEFLVTPSGTLVHGEFFSHIIRKFVPGLESFSVHQNEDYSLVLKYKPINKLNNIDFSLFKKAVTKRFDIETKLVIEKVNNIEKYKSGKFKYITSDLISKN